MGPRRAKDHANEDLQVLLQEKDDRVRSLACHTASRFISANASPFLDCDSRGARRSIWRTCVNGPYPAVENDRRIGLVAFSTCPRNLGGRAGKDEARARSESMARRGQQLGGGKRRVEGRRRGPDRERYVDHSSSPPSYFQTFNVVTCFWIVWWFFSPLLSGSSVQVSNEWSSWPCSRMHITKHAGVSSVSLSKPIQRLPARQSQCRVPRASRPERGPRRSDDNGS